MMLKADHKHTWKEAELSSVLLYIRTIKNVEMPSVFAQVDAKLAQGLAQG